MGQRDFHIEDLETQQTPNYDDDDDIDDDDDDGGFDDDADDSEDLKTGDHCDHDSNDGGDDSFHLQFLQCLHWIQKL